ncbi:MAG: hypothetical protein J6X59_05535 [Bacteroidales bacterium]|nr:hypothetical protein [Bacteroidales bacterium]
MKKNRKIFRWGVFLLLCLLAATLPAAIVYRCHTVSLSQCDELYRKYVDNPGIRASFIKDFPVNDTLAVDVLLLEATDSLGWETLKTDFNIVTLSPQALQMLKNSKSSVGVRMTPKNDIGAPGDTVNLDNNYLLAIDNLEHSVGIFYTKNDQEREQTWHYHLYNFKTPKTNEQNN